MTMMLEAAWMQAALSLLYLLGYLQGVLHDIGHPIPKGYVMKDRVRTVPMSWHRRWHSYPEAAGAARGAHPSLVPWLYFQGPVTPVI